MHTLRGHFVLCEDHEMYSKCSYVGPQTYPLQCSSDLETLQKLLSSALPLVAVTSESLSPRRHQVTWFGSGIGNAVNNFHCASCSLSFVQGHESEPHNIELT